MKWDVPVDIPQNGISEIFCIYLNTYNRNNVLVGSEHQGQSEGH